MSSIDKIGKNFARQRDEDRRECAHQAALTQQQLENAIPESLKHAKPGNTAYQVGNDHSAATTAEDARLQDQLAELSMQLQDMRNTMCVADNTQHETPPRPNMRFGAPRGTGNRPPMGRPGAPNPTTYKPLPRTGWQGSNGTGNPPGQFGQAVTARAKYPRRDANGKVIMRLLDKPATRWEDLDQAMQKHLESYGFKNSADWKDKADTPCGLCGAEPNHWWSRCVRVWGATEKGRQTLGVARAADRVRQALAAEHSMDTVGEALVAFEHASQNGDYGTKEEVEKMLLQVAEQYDYTADDNADNFFAVCTQIGEPYGFVAHCA